ncbi:mitogen-activated protein kinase kinase kinase 1-like [Typha latifolia]|uniref:mitogen-activated protein kinase kinase kinase 1-like n=1 Tax=Typha latifolia TaxID=4733 RepID=UPI003C2E6000
MNPKITSSQRRRLERRNAIKNVEYEVSSDQPHHFDFSKTSFRIRGGVAGEVDLLCRTLGLTGPEEFAVPASTWAALKSYSDVAPPTPPNSTPNYDSGRDLEDDHRLIVESTVGIEQNSRFSFESEKDEEAGENYSEEVVQEEEEKGMRLGETARGLTESTSNYTRISSEIVLDLPRQVSSAERDEERIISISPSGSFKRMIRSRSWIRGDRLGSGSFGTVYEAISDDGFFFAVKEVSLLDQGSNAKQCIFQLEQEISLLSRFEHENIVQYFGSDKEEAKLYIFLELVTQGSLASLYQKYHLQDSQVSAYTRQILNGLNFLHERNVVHRDIKCANILVDAKGSVKLADFGLAKELTILNGAKSCKGTVYWMAPEVAKTRPYGPPADIWSLGCTVLEMLTRRVPYPDVEWAQALFKIGRGERPPIPNSLTRDARDFIQQCVQVNPDDRPSAAQLLKHPFLKR